jgi:hypothetical protein
MNPFGNTMASDSDPVISGASQAPAAPLSAFVPPPRTQYVHQLEARDLG